MLGQRLYTYLANQGLQQGGGISFQQFLPLMNELGQGQNAQQFWNMVDVDRSGVLSPQEFLTFCNQPQMMPYIQQVEAKYCQNIQPMMQQPMMQQPMMQQPMMQQPMMQQPMMQQPMMQQPMMQQPMVQQPVMVAQPVQFVNVGMPPAAAALVPGAVVFIRCKTTGKNLRVLNNGIVNGEGGQGELAKWVVEQAPNGIRLLNPNRGKFLRILHNDTVDCEGGRGDLTVWQVVRCNDGNCFSLQSVSTGKRLGVMQNGSVKQPSAVGLGNAASFQAFRA